MLSKKVYLLILIKLLFLVVISFGSESQDRSDGVCNKTETYVDYVQKEEKYNETIKGTKFCLKPKKSFKCEYEKVVWKTRKYTEPVEKIVTKQVCCKGYEYSRSKKCVPVCQQICENGKCVGPDRCECNAGYKHFSTYRCVPSCADNCQHGQCIAPEVCNCYTGYTKIDGKCKPLCDPPCTNGICIGPNRCDEINDAVENDENSGDEFLDTEIVTPPVIDNIEENFPFNNEQDYEVVGPKDDQFESEESEDSSQTVPTPMTEDQPCDDGFVLDGHGVCRTKCEVDCHFGKLINQTCVCDKGFKLAPNNPCVCEPFCEHDCLNGICMGNNDCLCEKDFKLSPENKFTCIDSNKCHCKNGDCITPEECKCWQGYRLEYSESNYHRCEPICGDPDDPQGCVNGKCVGTSICLCDPGFIHGPNNNYTCYANLSCEQCLAAEDTECLLHCYSTIDKTNDNDLQVFVIPDDDDSSEVFFYSAAFTCILIILLGIIILTWLRKNKKVNYNINKREKSPNNVYYSNSNGVNVQI